MDEMEEVDREIDIAATNYAIACVKFQASEDPEEVFETFWREYFYFHSK